MAYAVLPSVRSRTMRATTSSGVDLALLYVDRGVASAPRLVPRLAVCRCIPAGGEYSDIRRASGRRAVRCLTHQRNASGRQQAALTTAA